MFFNFQDKFKFFQTFAKQSHTGSVKTVATSSRYLASGGNDDRIVIYDMQNRSETQMLLHHTGTITSLSFTPDDTHLMTTSEDGSISAVRSGSWVVEKIWHRAHKGSPINHLTIHSSGKMALSLGKDLVLRTWNLVKGRQVFATNLNSKPSLGKVCECVEWSIDGKTFCLTGAKVCEIWSAETASVVKTISCQSKPNCIAWINETTIAIGMEDGNLTIAGINREKDVIIRAYEKRVKAIKFLNGKLVTVCSTGEVTMWSVTSDCDLEKMCSIEIGCRPICIALIETSDAGELVKEEIKVEEINTEIKTKNFGRSVEIEVEDEEIGFKTPKDKKKKRKSEKVSNLVEESPKIKRKKVKNDELIVEETKISPKRVKGNNNLVESSKKKKRNSLEADHVKLSHSKVKSPKSLENVVSKKKLKNKNKANVSLQEEPKEDKKFKNKKRKSMF